MLTLRTVRSLLRPTPCRHPLLVHPRLARLYSINTDEPRLSLTFTCTAPDCDAHRSSHTFTKRAYEHGVVLVECPGCHNRHLIADHLGWFADATERGKNATLEQIMAARGVAVTRGRIVEKGTFEFDGSEGEGEGEGEG